MALALASLAVADDKPAGAVQPATAEPSADSADPAKLQADRRRAAVSAIAQLGNSRFEIREEATKKLEQSGIEAIGPLLAAAAGDNLEVTCRAIRALGAIFDSEDEATFDAAEVALEQLAESSNRSAAQRAQTILAPQDIQGIAGSDGRRYRRWKRAIVRIRALGGIVKQMEPAGAEREITEIPPEETPWLLVILEEGWKGGGAGLVNLKRICVRFPLPMVYVAKGANLPGEALENLQRTVPQLRIEIRGKAMLGISAGDPNAPCRIKNVSPNSAAEKAGLMANDEILKYDGEELKNFQRLIEITGEHKPGDKIEIEIRRGGEILKLEAQLTGWAGDKPVETKK